MGGLFEVVKLVSEKYFRKKLLKLIHDALMQSFFFIHSIGKKMKRNHIQFIWNQQQANKLWEFSFD